MSRFYDCVIIGGGPAGLAVATGLARLLHTAVVLDSGVYRNGRERHLHNVIGYDHQDPVELRRKARSDILARYSTIDFRDTTVIQVRRGVSGNFEAIDQRGTIFSGRKLVLAVGVRDVMLEIDGYAECWARGIFHCLFCHGFENRGAASCGLLAEGTCSDSFMALHTARMALQFAQRVTLYTNGSSETTERLRAAIGINETRMRLDTRRIERLQMAGQETSQTIITFEDGSQVTEGFLAHAPQVETNGLFIEQLGLEVNASGEIKTTPPFLETSLKGVFAAGDCATPLRAVPQAAAMGGLVAVAVAHQVEADGSDR